MKLSANDYIPQDVPDVTDEDNFLSWTGTDKFNAIYTITLGELIENDIFDWSNSDVTWKDAAYNEEQYERVCTYFINRFYFREISIVPYSQWAQMLQYKLINDLMPKYKIMYALLDDDFDITQTKARYQKARNIASDYPETLLSANSDYVSSGRDTESGDIERGSILDAYLKYSEEFMSIDKMLLDELECIFIGLYTISLNGA